MSRPPLNLVAVSAGVHRPSRTHALVEQLLADIGAALPVRSRLVDLGELAPLYGGVNDRNRLPQAALEALEAVETADALIVASPIYRGTFTGLFKHFFDLIDQDALIDVPVLLAATGGSDRHALAIDHQFRPLFSFFQSLTLPIGVYASNGDFERYQVSSEALRARIKLAVERALPVLDARRVEPATGRHDDPIDGGRLGRAVSGAGPATVGTSTAGVAALQTSPDGAPSGSADTEATVIARPGKAHPADWHGHSVPH